ncbi:MAG: hypothetical protein MMC33_007627 [Icmadophila ericetorum]|nr:hypothetical protein [Icmadophila ericetorum]
MDPVFKPRRLVDVGLDRTREPVLLEPIEHCRYAALSYCWGKDLVDVLTTRKQNLDSNLKAIPLSSMPRTIQDAVVFCRGVKIQYIWIDSLCIVQDDDEDWLAESARMCEIYSNSYFTIAAQNAPSCKSGFLGQQKYGEVSWQRPFWTEFGQRDGSESLNKMYVRGPEPTVRMALYGRSNFSLQGRGWTLQENLLSTRIIHFTGNEMIWECDNRDFCECGHVDDLDYYEPGAMSKQALKRWRESSPQKFLGRNTWIKITEDYSNRMLTQERDKLVAISGLAKRTVIDVNKDTSRSLEEVSGNYLAGLWRDDLPINLLWHTDSGESSITSHKRPAKYRGPTWSWVSIDGPVRYSQIPAFAEEESHLAISESRCSPASPWNPLGPVTSGHLILSGLLVPVQLAITDEKPPVGYYGAITTEWRGQAVFVRARNLVPYQISLDLPSVINLKREDPTYQCWINRHEVEKCPHPTDCDFEETEKVFYCLKVASFYFPPRPPIIQYLVLTKSSTDPEQAYERVGIGAWGKWWPPPLDFHLFDGADVTTTTIKII